MYFCVHHSFVIVDQVRLTDNFSISGDCLRMSQEIQQVVPRKQFSNLIFYKQDKTQIIQ